MKVSFVGAGKMAEAVISSLIHRKTSSSHELFVSDIDKDRREQLKKKYAINVYSSNKVAAANSPIVVLAVKPQQLEDVLLEIAPEITRKHLVISIVAGKRIAFIENILKTSKVIRVMPNLAAVVGESMNVFCCGSRIVAADRKNAELLLGSFGEILEMEEGILDAVTAISGSGPAFLAYIAECIIEAGVRQGLQRKDARAIVIQSLFGTGKLMKEGGIFPIELIKAVMTPQGTTAKGMAVLEKSALPRIIDKTIGAATARSRELGG